MTGVAARASLVLVLVRDLVTPTPAVRSRCLCVLGSLEAALPRAPGWFGPGDPRATAAA